MNAKNITIFLIVSGLIVTIYLLDKYGPKILPFLIASPFPPIP